MEELKRRIEECCIPEPNSGCWLWERSLRGGRYGQFGGRRDPSRYAHRAAYEIYKGPIPDGMFVCHKCDTPTCVNPDHLWLGTNKENMQDAKRKGRTRGPGLKGDQNPCAKLFPDDIREIRASSETAAALAKRYGVSAVLISKVRLRQAWKHI